MNARAAKLVRRAAARIAPEGHLPELEKGLKRLWYQAGRRGRRGLRAHLERAIKAAPEDVAQVFGKILK